MYVDAVPSYLFSGEIDGEGICFNDRLVGFPSSETPAYCSPETRQEFFHPKGFGDVVVRTGIESLHLVGGVDPGR